MELKKQFVFIVLIEVSIDLGSKFVVFRKQNETKSVLQHHSTHICLVSHLRFARNSKLRHFHVEVLMIYMISVLIGQITETPGTEIPSRVDYASYLFNSVFVQADNAAVWWQN